MQRTFANERRAQSPLLRKLRRSYNVCNSSGTRRGVLCQFGFLTDEQRRRYGRFHGEPTAQEYLRAYESTPGAKDFIGRNITCYTSLGRIRLTTAERPMRSTPQRQLCPDHRCNLGAQVMSRPHSDERSSRSLDVGEHRGILARPVRARRHTTRTRQTHHIRMANFVSKKPARPLIDSTGPQVLGSLMSSWPCTTCTSPFYHRYSA